MNLSDYAVVIPAKGTSRRIPEKNKMLFYGKPLVEWSIMHAKLAGFGPEQIHLITDDTTIVDIAAKNGACWIWEPPEQVADPGAGHVVEWAVKQFIPDKHIITLLPSCPLRDPAWITTMIDMHKTGHWSVISAGYECTGYLFTAHHHMVWPPRHTAAKPVYMADMPQLYRGGGGLSLADKSVFTLPGGPVTFSGGPRHGLLLLGKKEAIRCLDLDDHEDWIVAEAMAAVLDGKVE